MSAWVTHGNTYTDALHAFPYSHFPPHRPSGAGKTTLLNLLIGNAGGRVEGAVEVNGRPLREVASNFKKLYTFVPQVRARV